MNAKENLLQDSTDHKNDTEDSSPFLIQFYVKLFKKEFFLSLLLRQHLINIKYSQKSSLLIKILLLHKVKNSWALINIF